MHANVICPGHDWLDLSIECVLGNMFPGLAFFVCVCCSFNNSLFKLTF